ncbi:radical SAM protein [archaeon]|nr:radical SAM protein [archaeon]
MKQIQFTSGCPNACSYCYEPKEMKYYDPEIPTDKEVQILDMNFLANPRAVEILKSLPKKKYEFVCGIDYRRLTQEIADLMKEKGFIKVRWAWDYQFGLQKIQKKTYQMFIKAGYNPKSLSVFILVNWKIPYVDCVKKLDLLKVWNVKVNDCCWDGGYKLAKPVYWTPEQIKKFRKMCRKHNQYVNFGIDPEFKS